MERQAVMIRQPEQAKNIDRITSENIIVKDRDTIIGDNEIAHLSFGAATAKRLQKPLENGARLGLTRLQRRTDDSGEIADILGDKEVMLHEAFDARQAGAVVIAHALGEHGLNVEGQALVGATARKMQMTTHSP